MQQCAPANGESTSITERTLNSSLSRLVEPLRLFHPTWFSLMAMQQVQRRRENTKNFASSAPLRSLRL